MPFLWFVFLLALSTGRGKYELVLDFVVDKKDGSQAHYQDRCYSADTIESFQTWRLTNQDESAF